MAFFVNVKAGNGQNVVLNQDDISMIIPMPETSGSMIIINVPDVSKNLPTTAIISQESVDDLSSRIRALK